MAAKTIAKNQVQVAPDGQTVTFEEIWKDRRCVVVFFRRFGLAAREISALLPALQSADVRLVGVGLEKEGVQEFIDGKFFLGDLFVDIDKAAYKGLGFVRMSMLGLVPAVLSRAARAAQAKAKELGLGGNLKGDGYQNGGALIVGAGGDPTLLQWKQEAAPDHVTNEEVLQALGIQLDPVPHATARQI